MKKILCFGEVLWDAFGEEKKAGGAPMNVARHLVQQHMAVAFASRVGADAPGDGLINFLKQNGLYSELIQTDTELPTCEVTVQLDEHKQANYIIPQPVSWDNIQPEQALVEAAKNASAIVYGSLACRTDTTLDTLLDLLDHTHALKIFDVNLRPPHYTQADIDTLAVYANVVKMNDEEMEMLIGGNGNLREQIEAFHEKYDTRTICVTRGGNGAVIWHDNQFYEHPGFKVKVGDTVGAGDSFLATFIVGLINDKPIDQALVKASAIGAFVASKHGANPVYDESEINEIMAQ